MSMSGGFFAETKPREATLHAVITRANGTVEDLGLISYYHRNPVIKAVMNAMIGIKRRLRTW